MKNTKQKIGLLLLCIGLLISCNKDLLDLAPIDSYGSENYWKTEAQVEGYIDGIHKNLRDIANTHTFKFGELRGGHYRTGTAADGSSLNDGAIIAQNFDANHAGVNNFANYYGKITNCNLFLARVKKADFMDDAKKNYFLGMVHGIRAFYYFDLYRIYGEVPLRLGVEVIDGELDPKKLYKPRAKASEVMAQIKDDLKKSLEYFGSGTDKYGFTSKAYWSKAATECLMGEVYLWNAKVTTGDNTADEEDLKIAKKHLENVVNNYGFNLQNDFANIFKNKDNSEIIFAARYLEGEATNGGFINKYTYQQSADVNNNAFLEDGSIFSDPFQLSGVGGIQRYEYIKELFLSLDNDDARRDATFTASYKKDNGGNLELWGTHVKKNIGMINSSGIRVFSGDIIYYRLAWVYLSLAEIANMEGNNTNVAKYINLVRNRAYGSNSNEFTASDFTTNELAILHEKDKEFIQEGQRWWDLRRMTLTKGGTHLVFVPEGSYDGTPILDEGSESHKVLWPLDKTLLDNDDALKQTEGY